VQPARVIVVAIGSAGDVFPLAALAQRLAQRGHDVVLMAGELYEGLAGQLGLAFEPIHTTQQAGTHAMTKQDPHKALSLMWHRISQANRIVYAAIERLRRPGRTVLVGSTFALGTRLAQEKLGLPLATVHLAPAAFLSAIDPPAFKMFRLPRWLPVRWRESTWRFIERAVIDPIGGKDLNAFRSELGLAPCRHVMGRWAHSPDLVLGLFEPWFAQPQADWPPNTHLTGFPLFDQARMAEPDADLQRFLAAGDAPLVFVTGSAMREARPFFANAVEVCRLLGKRGVLLTRHASQVPEALPPFMHHALYEPLSTLLPRAAALVSHGGIGTVSQALAAGVPQLVMPYAHDQFDNAQRVMRLGVGTAASPRDAPAALARTLEKLLASPVTAASCAHYRDALAAPGSRPQEALDRACVRIEGLLAQP
jgi:rhamnosyltransferase subunit B